MFSIFLCIPHSVFAFSHFDVTWCRFACKVALNGLALSDSKTVYLMQDYDYGYDYGYGLDGARLNSQLVMAIDGFSGQDYEGECAESTLPTLLPLASSPQGKATFARSESVFQL